MASKSKSNFYNNFSLQGVRRCFLSDSSESYFGRRYSVAPAKVRAYPAMVVANSTTGFSSPGHKQSSISQKQISPSLFG